MRCLKDRSPAADLFGIKGRRWLAEQQLPICERETVDAGLRQVLSDVLCEVGVTDAALRGRESHP
jgi:hypothetical protein